jgi:hypothetical protein
MRDKSSGGRSRSLLLAVEDADYLQKDELRPFRLALEFNKVDLALKEMGIVSSIVVFGSSRILSPEKADEELRSAKDSAARKAACNQTRLSEWYEEARKFARLVSERGGAMAPEGGVRRNVITTGGGPGIMEAANRGAWEAGAPSIGFNIVLPTEQIPNSYSTPELTFRFHYFAMRKMHFAMRANALVVFPGGFGTMDELFEILTLKQTRKTPSMPVILFCRSYWKKIVDFDALVDLGMIEPEEFELFDFVDTAEEAWEVMVRRGLTVHTPLHEP